MKNKFMLLIASIGFLCGCSGNKNMFSCDGVLTNVRVSVNSEEEENISRDIWLGLIADSKDRGIFPELTTKRPITFAFSYNDASPDPTFTVKSSDKGLDNFDQNTSPPIKFPPVFQTVKNNDDEIVYLFNNAKYVKGQNDYEVKKITFYKKTNNAELLFGNWSYKDDDSGIRTYISSNRISANCKK